VYKIDYPNSSISDSSHSIWFVWHIGVIYYIMLLWAVRLTDVFEKMLSTLSNFCMTIFNLILLVKLVHFTERKWPTRLKCLQKCCTNFLCSVLLLYLSPSATTVQVLNTFSFLLLSFHWYISLDVILQVLTTFWSYFFTTVIFSAISAVDLVQTVKSGYIIVGMHQPCSCGWPHGNSLTICMFEMIASVFCTNFVSC